MTKTIKNRPYVINLDECADIGTHWIALYVKNNKVIYFDSFGVEHVPKEIKLDIGFIGHKSNQLGFIGHKNMKTNIFRIQADNSIMCEYFCIRFIDFMFAGKTLINYTNLFSPYYFKMNDDIILSYFKSTECLKKRII